MVSKLLDTSLYLQIDFNRLKTILNKIESAENITSTAFSNLKDLKNSKDEKIKEICNNYDKVPSRELFGLFLNQSEEQITKVKNTEAYRFFKESASNKDKLI